MDDRSKQMERVEHDEKVSEVMHSSFDKKNRRLCIPHLTKNHYTFLINETSIFCFELRLLQNIKVKKGGHYITIEVISHSM